MVKLRIFLVQCTRAGYLIRQRRMFSQLQLKPKVERVIVLFEFTASAAFGAFRKRFCFVYTRQVSLGMLGLGFTFLLYVPLNLFSFYSGRMNPDTPETGPLSLVIPKYGPNGTPSTAVACPRVIESRDTLS